MANTHQLTLCSSYVCLPYASLLQSLSTATTRLWNCTIKFSGTILHKRRYAVFHTFVLLPTDCFVDVAVLHDIIVHAQELLPGLPERERLPTNALFTAYYDILPNIGINADHDSRYARVLFKVGGMRGPESLYEKFEEVLSRMGIEIQFDHDDREEVMGEHDGLDGSLSIDQLPKTTAAVDAAEHRGRPRRNSESSLWDRSNGGLGDRNRRTREVFQLNELHRDNKAPRFPSRQSLIPHQPEDRRIPTTAQQDNKFPHVDRRINSRGSKSNSRLRERSISSDTSMRVHYQTKPRVWESQPQLAAPDPAVIDELQPAFGGTSLNSNKEWRSLGWFDKANPIDKLSESDIIHTTTLSFAENQFNKRAKSQIQKWRDKSANLRRSNKNLEMIAFQHDKSVLLHQALETWYNRWRGKRQADELRKFFAYLERRATKARDLFLLQKAFTHWAQSSIEEIQRTAAARRYIMRTRVFNAWKDITAVNELKVRRYVLRKFFGIWRHRSHAISANSDLAATTFESNVVRNTYRTWIRNFLSHITSRVQVNRIKQRTVTSWAAMLRKLRGKEMYADEIRRSQLLKRTLRNWKLRADETSTKYRQAELQHISAVCGASIKKWRRETRFAPAQVLVHHDIKGRLLRHTFELWFQRSKQARQSVQFDRARVLREAWISWSYQLRFRAVQSQVVNNLLVQTLYKWALKERMLLAQRLRTRSNLRRCFKTWLHVSRTSREESSIAESIALHQGIIRTKRLAMEKIIFSLRQRKNLEWIAVERYPLNLLRSSVNTWSDHSRHLQQLRRWASDAAFYFLASRSLRIWAESVEISKREKRKIAYGNVRRLIKFNIAKKSFLQWRERARNVASVQVQALNILHNRNMIIGMNAFDRWRAYTAEAMEMEFSCRNTLLRRLFVTWRTHLSRFQMMQSEAMLNFEELQQNRYMKKFRLRTLQIRAQVAYASDIHHRNSKRTFRKMFTYWRQRALQKRHSEQNGSSTIDMSSGSTIYQGNANAWSDFEEGPEFDNGLEATRTQILIPGYLSTPSKRNERILAATTRFSSTTPRVPLSAPMERHLRAQYSGGGDILFRKLKPRTIDLAGFEDVKEAKKSLDDGMT